MIFLIISWSSACGRREVWRKLREITAGRYKCRMARAHETTSVRMSLVATVASPFNNSERCAQDPPSHHMYAPTVRAEWCSSIPPPAKHMADRIGVDESCEMWKEHGISQATTTTHRSGGTVQPGIHTRLNRKIGGLERSQHGQLTVISCSSAAAPPAAAAGGAVFSGSEVFLGSRFGIVGGASTVHKCTTNLILSQLEVESHRRD